MLPVGRKKRLDLVSRTPFERCRHVLVGVRRQRDLTVAHHFHHDAQVLTLDEQQCREGMSKIVKALSRQSGPLKQSVVEPDQVAGIEWCADGAGEDKALLLPTSARN